MIVLIYGLPSTGKSTLAEQLNNRLNFDRLNGDILREKYNDWDFSIEGRLRQAVRVRDLCQKNTLVDIVCPLTEMHDIINADFTILMDTNPDIKYQNTFDLFQKQEQNNIVITNFSYCIDNIINKIQGNKSWME